MFLGYAPSQYSTTKKKVQSLSSPSYMEQILHIRVDSSDVEMRHNLTKTERLKYMQKADLTISKE